MPPVLPLALGLVAALTAAPRLDASLNAAIALAMAAVFGLSRGRFAWAGGWALGVVALLSVPVGPTLDGPVVVDAVITGLPSGRTVDAELGRWRRVDGPWTARAGRVRLVFAGPAPAPGTRWLGAGRAHRPRGPTLPGEPDPVNAARRAGVATVIDLEEAEPIGGVAPDDGRWGEGNGAAVARAIATGDRSGVSPETDLRLRRTGTLHVLSVSGGHVAFVAACTGGAVAWLLRAFAVIRPRGVSLAPAWAFGAACGVAFCAFAGAPASAARAALGYAAFAALRATGRRSDAEALVAASAVGVLLFDPGALATPGLQLSFLAVLGMIRIAPLFAALIPPDAPRPLQAVGGALAASIGATLGTIPVLAWTSQQIAAITPVANLLALPFATFVLSPLAFAVAFAPVALARWISPLAAAAGDVWLLLLAPFDVAPLPLALGPGVAALAALALVVPSRATVLALGLGAALFAPRPPRWPTVTFLAVGQGDATAIRWPDGRCWLIDGGPPNTAVARWLRREGCDPVAVVIGSHAHPDHIGGLVPVLETLGVGALWLPEERGAEDLVALAHARGIPVRTEGPHARAPGLTVCNETNDRSLWLDLPGIGLFPGDAEACEEAAGLPGLAHRPLLKVPHHGSRTSSSPAFLAAVRPVLAVAGIGPDNRFGHPHAEVVDRYEALGVPLLRTDRDGTVEVEVRPGALFVRSWRPGAGWSATARVPTSPPRTP